MDEQPFATPLGPHPSVPTKPNEPKVAEVDHLTEIAELARGLHNVSPSGAETVSAKILEHIAALQEGK